MTKDIEKATVDAVEKVETEQDDLIKLSSGVVLRGKKVNPLLLIKVMAAFPRPKPPIYFNKAMGREMENPDDPDYLDRVQAWKMDSSNVTLNAMILHGTEIVTVPKGVPKPENDEWLDDYNLLGVPVHPQNSRWRYLTWVTDKAVLDENDLMKIQEVVGRLSGISEAAVKSAENFPGSDEATG